MPAVMHACRSEDEIGQVNRAVAGHGTTESSKVPRGGASCVVGPTWHRQYDRSVATSV